MSSEHPKRVDQLTALELLSKILDENPEIDLIPKGEDILVPSDITSKNFEEFATDQDTADILYELEHKLLHQFKDATVINELLNLVLIQIYALMADPRAYQQQTLDTWEQLNPTANPAIYEALKNTKNILAAATSLAEHAATSPTNFPTPKDAYLESVRFGRGFEPEEIEAFNLLLTRSQLPQAFYPELIRTINARRIEIWNNAVIFIDGLFYIEQETKAREELELYRLLKQNLDLETQITKEASPEILTAIYKNLETIEAYTFLQNISLETLDNWCLTLGTKNPHYIRYKWIEFLQFVLTQRAEK